MAAGLVLLPRLEDGTVDLGTDLAQGILDQGARVAAMPAGPVKAAEEAALIRILGEVGWWEMWLKSLAPGYVTSDFASFHRQFWNWLITIGEARPRPMVACWPRGAAKALALTEPIPTVDGWTTMGDVRVGDLVLDHAGRPVEVTVKSPVRSKPGYRVVFDDGSDVVCSGDHLWTVLSRTTLDQMRRDGVDLDDGWPSWRPARSARGHGGRRSGAETLTTTELIPRLLSDRPDQRERLMAIPLAPIEGRPADLPIDPYWLGYWLGDGTSKSAQITVGDADLPEARELLGASERISAQTQEPSGAWRLSFTMATNPPGQCGRGHETRVTPAGKWWCPSCQAGDRPAPLRPQGRLRELGVLGDKHVPAVYLRASVGQREALLAGLMDSDGTVDKRARTTFVSTSHRLAVGVLELVDSLGYPARITTGPARLAGRHVSDLWRVQFRASVCPFRLTRKAGRWTRPKFAPLRRIDRIEPVGPIDCACIGVDSADHLYLAGRRPTPTHNTTSVQLALLYIACHRLRGYCLYVGLAQTAVEDKVGAVGELLISPTAKLVYPEVAQFYETGDGTKRDWRRSRIRTSSGFTLDAFGMDQGMRGVKVDEMRPGCIVLDDIEEYIDSPYMTQKRIDVLTRSIIPAGATNVVYFYIQNKIHSDSIMARMLDGRADFLGDRITVGPIPQIEDLVTETYEDEEGLTRHRIVGGTPTWPEGLGLEVSNQQLLDEGPAAFLSEKQHDTESIEGTMFQREMWRYVELEQLPRDLVMRRAWDLAATEGGGDWTVGVLLGQSRRNGNFYVVDVRRGQWGDAKVEDNVSDTADADAEDWGLAMLRTAIEDQPGAAGKAWRRRWQRDILVGHPVDLVPPQGNKAYRAQGWASAQQHGQVFLVKAGWNAAFVREHAQFDVEQKGRHDDQVDASSLAFNRLTLAPKRRSRARSAAGRQVG